MTELKAWGGQYTYEIERQLGRSLSQSVFQHALSGKKGWKQLGTIRKSSLSGNTYPEGTDKTCQRLLHRFPHQCEQFDQALSAEDQVCFPGCELSVGQDPPSEGFCHVLEGFLCLLSVTLR